MTWQTPITDRSEADVIEAKEFIADHRHETAQTTDLKGMLNRSDVERVINNIGVIFDRLGESKTITNVPDFPTRDYMRYIVDLVQEVYNTRRIYHTTPDVPKQPLNTYQKWNDIEQIILDVYSQLLSDIGAYAGSELIANDNILL